MPRFGDAEDEIAFQTVAESSPEHCVVQVEDSAILVGGGGIHCITQQQPKP